MYIKETRKPRLSLSLSLAEVFIAILLIYLFWYVQVYGNNLLILYGATIASFICVVIHMLCRGEIVLHSYPLGIRYLFVLALYLFFTSFLVADNTSSALSSTITFLAFSIICFVITYISTEQKSIDWLINIIFFNTILCCYWISFRGVYKYGYGIVLGIFNNPNIFGLGMVLGIFSIAYKAGTKLGMFYVYILLSLWPLYSIIGCGSRKSMIAGLLIFIIWMFLLSYSIIKRGNIGSKILLIIVIFIVFLLVIYFFTNIYSNMDMAERMSRFAKEDSNSFRIYLYQQSFQIFMDNIIFGVGMNQFQYYSLHNAIAHSTYAEMIADFGLIGSIIYIFPIIQAFISSFFLFFSSKFNYYFGIVLGLLFSELFLGSGQVFFLQTEHFIAWTIIFFIIFNVQLYVDDQTSIESLDVLRVRRFLK